MSGSHEAPDYDARTQPAPADARPRRPWSTAAKVVAYALLSVVALVSIWVVDRKVRPRPAAPPDAPGDVRAGDHAR